PAVVTDLGAAIDSANETETIAKGVELIGRITALVAALAEISHRLDSAVGTGVADLHDFATKLPGALLDFLVVRFGEDAAPTITSILVLLGLIDRTHVPAADAAHPEHIVRKLRFDRFGQFFHSPIDYAQDISGWGTNNLAPLFAPLGDFLDHTLVRATFTPSPPKPEAGWSRLRTTTHTGTSRAASTSR